MLGRAKRAEAHANKCVLICEAPDRRRLEARKQTIRDEIRRMRYLSYDKEKLETRLARLSGGVAEIHVGAHSAPEQKQLVLRYQKALCALQSAQRSAVVPGGGATYRHLASRIERQWKNGGSRTAAAAMLTWALRLPEGQLIKSVGGDPILLRDSAENLPQRSRRVFDVCERAYVDPSRLEILDSAEITGEVVKRSISAAATILRSEVSVAKL
jgi:chaperonin GroEL